MISGLNYPLIHKGVYYYQTDWNLTGLRFQTTNNEMIEYPLINLLNNQNKFWLTWISNNKSLEEGIIGIINNLEGYCSVYNEKGQFLGNMELNETVKFNSPLTLIEIISSTGLQIKIDPGISTIYFGFCFLMLSTLMSYVTYSQIWILKKKKKIIYWWNYKSCSF